MSTAKMPEGLYIIDGAVHFYKETKRGHIIKVVTSHLTGEELANLDFSGSRENGISVLDKHFATYREVNPIRSCKRKDTKEFHYSLKCGYTYFLMEIAPRFIDNVCVAHYYEYSMIVVDNGQATEHFLASDEYDHFFGEEVKLY